MSNQRSQSLGSLPFSLARKFPRHAPTHTLSRQFDFVAPASPRLCLHFLRAYGDLEEALIGRDGTYAAHVAARTRKEWEGTPMRFRSAG